MRNRLPGSWAQYEYFRRVGGFRAKEALALSRAERWASESGLELGIELGVASLCHRRATDDQVESHWQDAGYEFSVPLVYMPRPEGVSDRVTAALLAVRLLTDQCG
jgi:hypothetical protein